MFIFLFLFTTGDGDGDGDADFLNKKQELLKELIHCCNSTKSTLQNKKS